MYKKGTILLRKRLHHPKLTKSYVVIMPFHEDMIQDSFWEKHKAVLDADHPNTYQLCENDNIPELVLSQMHGAAKKIEDGFKNLV